jgi:transcriptional regulator with XRE-family HTH domain
MPQPNLRLRHERQLRGWSQGRLAEHIDVPDYYISRWERGEVLPSPFYQQKLCELFGKSAEELGFLQPVNETPLPGTLRLEEGTIVTSADAETSPVSPASILTEQLPEQELSSPSREPSSAPLPSSPHDHSPAPLETRSFPSTFPSMPTPLPPVPHTPSPHQSRPPWRPSVLLWIALVVLLFLVGTGIITFLTMARPAATPTVVGQVYFLSSGQFNDTTNQGMADQVQVEVHTLPEPVAGKSYYAWLLPDADLPENPSLLLGKVVLTNGTSHLFYQDPQYTNLLTTMSRFLITEEDATTPPLTPSTDSSTWRYEAQIPQVRPRATPGEASYSLLDHVRHLLSSDPTVHAHGLTGGLIKWLLLNSGKLAEWSSAARGEWQPGGTFDTHLLRQDLTRILDYLDGATYAWQDVPPTSTPTNLVDPREGSIGLLQFTSQQQPPGYLNHIEFHLHGLVSSPGATAVQRERAGQIEAAINTINAWLEQVRQDARRLIVMTDPQLRQPSALALLNDLQIMATAAYSGKTDPVTGTIQQGAEQVAQAIQRLATLDILLYKG